MWTLITRFPAPWPPARAPFWWWMPLRAWRLRRWPIPISGHGRGLEVLPVINKIDLPAARPAEVKAEIEEHHRRSGGRCGDFRQNGAPHSFWSGSNRKDYSAPTGEPDRTSGADLRQPVRRLPGRHRLPAGKRRTIRPGIGRQDDGHRGGLQNSGSGRHASSGGTSLPRSWARERWAISPPPSKPSPTPE